MPAPTRAKRRACSYTWTSNPARRSQAAAASPPMPAPTTATRIHRQYTPTGGPAAATGSAFEAENWPAVGGVGDLTNGEFRRTAVIAVVKVVDQIAAPQRVFATWTNL